MTKQEEIMYFLGQLKANIEHLSADVGTHRSPLYDKFSDLERFFNTNMQSLFFSGNNIPVTTKTAHELSTEIAALVNKYHD